MLVAKTRMYETKQSGWIQQAEGVCAGATKSTYKRGGGKIRVRNAPHLDRARNRVRRARHGVARDFMAVNLVASRDSKELAAQFIMACKSKGDLPRNHFRSLRTMKTTFTAPQSRTAD
jgi:hypothetical protein